MSRLRYLAGALSLLLTLPGCIYRGSAVNFSPASLREPGWVSAPGVVFEGQQGLKDCGPAALAMVLSAQHSPVSTAEVAAACPADERGVGAGQLRDYARQQGYSAFLVRGELSDLEKELSEGRPVIVGLLKPTTARKAIAHYEVVVGLNRERALVATIDPAGGWRRYSVAGFLAEWNPTERLMLAILPPAPSRPQVSSTSRF